MILHNYHDLMTNSSVYLPWVSVAGIYKRSPRCDHHQQIMFELDPVVEDAENAQPSGGQLGLSKNGARLQRKLLIGAVCRCQILTELFSSSSSASSPAASSSQSRSQWAQPDLHRELQIPVGTAGPQPRVADRSGHCRTSTATSRSQWALPDLNRDCQIAVGTAGPQPRLPDRSGHCRTSTGRMSEKMSDRMSEDMPDRMPHGMSDRMPENMSDRMPQDMPDRMPEDMWDRMPEDLPDRMPEDMPEDMSEHMPDRMPDRMPEDMSDRMPEDLPGRKCINVMVGITRSKVNLIYFKRE